MSHTTKCLDNKRTRDAMLEEYKTLRQEILDMQKLQHDVTLFIFTGVSAIYALAFDSKNLYLLFISYMILIPLRCRHIFYHEMIIKTATYIQVVIERNIEGLHWENSTHKGGVEDSKAYHEFRPMRIHYYIYSIVAWCTAVLISLYTISDIERTSCVKGVIIAAAVTLSAVISRYDWVVIRKSDKIREYYIDNWKKCFREMRHFG